MKHFYKDILIILIILIISSIVYNYSTFSNISNVHHKVCYITAIYGKYESSCKPFKKQTLESDFICFTDAVDIKSNGWIIDNTPYHIENKSPLDNDTYIN
jgi:hypothetical protein